MWRRMRGGVALVRMEQDRSSRFSTMQREIAGLDVEALRWTGRSAENDTCSHPKNGPSENLYANRDYELVDPVADPTTGLRVSLVGC